jgi:exopolyphosphatase/guanosine-5'-triphosphate,3'-diphosphate pyrophosphatase
MRLVIYSQQETGRLHEVENVKAVARLRNYLNEGKELSEQGMNILITTLKSFKKVVDTYELTDFVCVATATIRQAINRDAIKHIVQEKLSWNMQILSEEKEAYYGYLSVVNSTTITEGITVDIGGGSTEVTYFKNRILLELHSFPFGALSLSDFFNNHKSKEKNIAKLRDFLHEQFYSLGWLQDKQVPLIGIGGSARNLAQIDQNQKKYPLAGLHQYQMNDSDIAGISNYLASLSGDELKKVDGLSSDRADTILPAVIIFHSLQLTINSENFILSRKGLRDGVFYEKLARDSQANLYPDVLKDSLFELVAEYNLDMTQIEHTKFLIGNIFHALKTEGIGSLTKNDWTILELACHVYNSGKYIDSESSSQHTFYLLANRTIDGLMHIDRLTLALIASYKNKTLFKQFIHSFKPWFLKKQRKKIALLGSMLKFTYSLDATKRQVVQDLDVKVKKNGNLNLTLYCNNDFMPEQYQTEKQKKHLEKTLHKTIELQFIPDGEQ